ncbi:hypothetical protein B1R94_08640 [Mycolicibacterium litorale]|nr:hypothetical protein B1R94_08640 [Mycolicibacterium litorale]
MQTELVRVKKASQALVSERDKQIHALRTQLKASEAELASLGTQLDSEQRGRRRLAEELGDSTERARRLLPLVRQDMTALEKQIDSERLGPGRTKLTKRLTALGKLAEMLDALYELDTRPEVNPLPPAQQNPAAQVTVEVSDGVRVSPLGGNNHIGGSALLIEAGETRILIDAGLRPNAPLSRPGPQDIDVAMKEKLDAVIITHAHADHAGYVPWVIARQRRARIFCTPQTALLLPTVWNDSVQVMRAEADAVRRSGNHEEPPYGDIDVEQAEGAIVKLPCGQTRAVGDLQITLFPAGHILGAAGVVVDGCGRRVVVTGDIDDRAQASVGGAKIPPKLAANADLLIIETTYCDSQHRDRAAESNDLIATAEGVLALGGRILIPAFGLGRAQEIALLVGERLPEVPVRVDGLARKISEIYELEGAPAIFHGQVSPVTNRERDIQGFHNGIVITTSGMLTGGAAVPWATAILQEHESALFLCGHQDEEAPGKQLERLLDADPDRRGSIDLRDPSSQRTVTIPVLAKVMRYNLSAHADSKGLVSIINEVNPKAIMLVHGEPVPQKHFQRVLETAGRRVVSNCEVWKSESPVVDKRHTRRRHAARRGRR